MNYRNLALLVCLFLVDSDCLATGNPNIVFIMADDLGWADVSTGRTNLGDPSDFYETPALAKLALQGMAFTSAYANQNCAPTRTAILSGAYATRPTNNVYQVGNLNRGSNNKTLLVGPAQGLPSGGDALPNDTITHAETLQSAGYKTAYVGKFHVTDRRSKSQQADIERFHGFDKNFGGTSAGHPSNYHARGGKFGPKIGDALDPYAADYTQEYVDANIKPYNHGATDGDTEADIDALVGTAKHVSDASADAVIDFMEANKSEPFFIQYSAHAVHTPIGDKQARADLLAKYQRKTPGAEDSNASFGALIEGLDQSVARIVRYLQHTPDPNRPGESLDKNTIVIFYSDNGGRLDQSNNSVLKGQKGELDEGGIRVPLIVWSGNPALVDGGTINDTVVMPIDFYTTFASLAGAPLPNGQLLDGEDLSRVLADAEHQLDREPVYWHLPGYLAQGRDQKPQSVVRAGKWKLLYNYEDQSLELYDLDRDVAEQHNLATNTPPPKEVQKLGTKLMHWLATTRAPLATLRTGTVRLNFTGDYYADGEISVNDGLLEIRAGEEVPFVLGGGG